MSEVARSEAVEGLLREHGIPDARVRAEGPEGEVAAVIAPPEVVARLAGLAPAIKALGFRYVALDLTGIADERASPGATE